MDRPLQNNLVLEVLTDEGFINSFINHPDIFCTICEDAVDVFECDLKIQRYIGFLKDGEMIAIYGLFGVNAITLDIHANVLPKYRKKYSKDTGWLILDYIYNEMSHINKVIASIPHLYENVYRFTKSQGLVDEGINRQSWQHDGKIYDIWLLGITRSEIEARLYGNSGRSGGSSSGSSFSA